MMLERRKLWITFATIALVKLLLASFVLSPTIFSDEYFYAKMGESIATSGSLAIHGEKTNAYPPLYPLLISPAYIVNDVGISYILIKLLNILVSTAIIFPIFFLAKEFVEEKKAYMISALVGVMPLSFSFSPYIMSENLFYPLVITSVYAMFKSLTTENRGWPMFAGGLIGLSILTKVVGLILIPVYATAVLINTLKEKEHRWKKAMGIGVMASVICILVLSPWLIRNSITFGGGMDALIGSYTQEFMSVGKSDASLPVSFVLWTMLYSGMLILASGIIPVTVFHKFVNDKNSWTGFMLMLSAIGWTILGAANHAARGVIKGTITWLPGRPIGRYIDVVLPLIVLVGYVGLTRVKKNDGGVKKTAWTLIPMMVLLSITTFFSLFPINNLSLSWVGAIKYVLEWVFYNKEAVETVFFAGSFVLMALLLTLLPCAVLLVNKKVGLQSRKVTKLLFLFFLTTSIVSYSMIIINAKSWNDSEQTQLGKLIAQHIPSEATIVIDERLCKGADLLIEGVLCNEKGDTTVAGFWIRNVIRVDKQAEAGEYMVSSEATEELVAVETKNFVVYAAR